MSLGCLCLYEYACLCVRACQDEDQDQDPGLLLSPQQGVFSPQIEHAPNQDDGLACSMRCRPGARTKDLLLLAAAGGAIQGDLGQRLGTPAL